MKKLKNPTIELIITICYITFSVILSQFISSLILVLILPRSVSLDNTYAMAMYYVLYIVISILLIYAVPNRFFKTKLISKEILGIRDYPTFTEIGLSVVGYIIVYVFGVLITTIMSNFAFFNLSEEQDIGFGMLYSAPEKIIAFLVVCILVPIFEELVFRGAIYGQLRKKLPKKTWAKVVSILVVSLIFALLHGQWNVAVVVFVLSVVSCLLREFTGNINSGIFLHIIKNTIAFILVYLVGV